MSRQGYLTHWLPRDVAVAWACAVKSFSDECHWTLLIRSQHKFRWWHGTVRQQVITWTNVDPDLCCHMASQRINKHLAWLNWYDFGVWKSKIIWGHTIRWFGFINPLSLKQNAEHTATTLPFSNAFSCIKIFVIRLKFHWSLFLGGQLTKSQSAFVIQPKVWHRVGD